MGSRDVRIPAAASSAVRDLLGGRPQPAEVLGAGPRALYLHAARSATVLALVTHDAVRLPCSLVIAQTSAELPLTELAPGAAQSHVTPASIGGGTVGWRGPHGRVEIQLVREWRPPQAPHGVPHADRLTRLAACLRTRELGVEAERVAALWRATEANTQFAAAVGLIGCGPGLTPSGDDLLAGYLIGARAFGVASTGIRHAVAGHAADATTALSCQLLRHAVHGESIAELAALVAALQGRRPLEAALGAVLAIGHTSGTALAAGVATAGHHALHPVPAGRA